MHGPTCIFWANLTPLSLQTYTDPAFLEWLLAKRRPQQARM